MARFVYVVEAKLPDGGWIPYKAHVSEQRASLTKTWAESTAPGVRDPREYRVVPYVSAQTTEVRCTSDGMATRTNTCPRCGTVTPGTHENKWDNWPETTLTCPSVDECVAALHARIQKLEQRLDRARF